MEHDELLAHLRTLGLDEARQLELGATLTRETWMASTGAGTVAAEHAWLSSTVGPLPYIALSGLPVTDTLGRPTDRPPRADSLPPGSAPDLEVVGVLGEGGMGRVHLARQRSLGRDVAVKTLKDDVADVRAVEMLRDEATTMGRLEHPNVVPVHAVGRDDQGRLVLVMKRVDGISWRELLDDPAHPRWTALAPRPEDRLELHLDVLAQVANALHFAHSRGVVHRDVKPENVLLGEHGEVYLADWGVATRLGVESAPAIVGTPTYMAPEMVLGDAARVDARTDVFLLGATLHEVLVGAPPHAGDTVHAVLVAAYDAVPPRYPPGVPSELQAIARRAMAASPDARFDSALAFRRALDERRRRAAARTLIASAQELLAQLPHSLGVETRHDGGVDRSLTECRFAFVQALREWPESEEARAGLDAVLGLAVKHELSRENAVAARALMSERSVTDPELERAIEALEGALAARRWDAERLRALTEQEDLRIGLRSRMAVFGALIALGVAISGYFSFGPGSVAGPPTPTALIGVACLFVLLVAFGGLLLRRHLFANAAGRRAAHLLMSGMLALLAHRVAGAVHGVSGTAVLSMDLVLLALVAGAAGVLVPRVAWASLVPLAGIPLTAAFPERIALVFSSVSVLAILAVGGLWLSAVRSKGTDS